jgi:hypothetical protein
MRWERVILVGVVWIAALSMGPIANAHEENALSGLTVIDSVEPHVDGLEIKIVHLGAPAIVARNDSDRVLEVLDADGRPFLRIGPRGVWANAASPMTYRSLTPGASAPIDAGKPRWTRLSSDPYWSWFDPRLTFARDRHQWRIDMRVGDLPVVARGGFEGLQGHGHFVAQLEAPVIDGLELRLIQGPIPALFARNDTGRTLHVAGRDGEPMLRIEPHGVWANLSSPSYYLGGAQAILEVPRDLDASAPPEWRKVSSQPVWAWLEQRAVVPADLYERNALGDGPETVMTWTSPMTIGKSSIAVGGRVEWRPPASAGEPLAATRDGGSFRLLTVIALMGMGATILYSRRRTVVS